MLERVQDRSWLQTLHTGGIRLHGAQRALAQWAIVDDYNTILDLHGQDTRLLQYFAQKFSLRACGIADHVEQARALRREAPEAEIFCARKEDIPWRSESFDCVFYQVKAHEAERNPAFLQEAARVLKPGGQMLIAVQGLPDGLCRLAAAAGLTETDAQMNTRALLQAMEQAGLADVSYRMVQPLVGVAMGWKRT